MQDGRGRVRVSKARREALLDEFERSGMSMAAFSRMVGVKYQTFARWVWLRREARMREAQHPSGSDQSSHAQGPATGARWLEALVTLPAGSASGFAPAAATRLGDGDGLRVQLPGGGTMHVDRASQVLLAAELLRVLEAAQRSRTPC